MDVRAFSSFFALLTVAANAFVLGAVALAVAGRFSEDAADLARRTREYLAPAAIPFAWIVAAVATAGSLYYSKGAGYVPCELCWYQRIAMYPLVLILGIAAFKRDPGVRRYVLPLVAAGALISVYHYQLQRFPEQGSLACALEAPCTLTYVWRFHYISIPFMALSAFALIATLLVIVHPPRARAGDAHPARAKELIGR